MKIKDLTHKQLCVLEPSQKLISNSIIDLKQILKNYNVELDDSPLSKAWVDLQEAESKFFVKYQEALNGQENTATNENYTKESA